MPKSEKAILHSTTTTIFFLIIFDVMGTGSKQKDAKALNEIIFSLQLIELTSRISLVPARSEIRLIN